MIVSDASWAVVWTFSQDAFDFGGLGGNVWAVYGAGFLEELHVFSVLVCAPGHVGRLKPDMSRPTARREVSLIF